MLCANCNICINAKVEEILEEDCFGFEYVTKNLTCSIDSTPNNDNDCPGFKKYVTRSIFDTKKVKKYDIFKK